MAVYTLDGETFSNRVSVNITASIVSSSLLYKDIVIDCSTLGDDFWLVCKSDAGDIRVSASDESTRLPVEIITGWNTTTKVGWIKTKVPVITSLGGTVYIYFGNATLSQPAASTTYGSQNVYHYHVSVLHLEELYSDSAPQWKDSTSYGNDMGATATNILDSQTGVVRNCLRYNYPSVTSGYSCIPTNSSIEFATGDSFTLEAWVKRDVTSTVQNIIRYDNNSGNRALYWVRFLSSNHIEFVFGKVGGTLFVGTSTNSFSSTSTWYHIVATLDYSGGYGYIFVNGVSELSKVDTSSAWDTALYPTSLCVGSLTEFEKIRGFVDEVKIYNNPVTLDWAKFTYMNELSPLSTYSFGSVETPTDSFIPLIMII